MTNRIAQLNHIAAGILVIGAILVLIGQLVRFRSTSLELKRVRR